MIVIKDYDRIFTTLYVKKTDDEESVAQPLVRTERKKVCSHM